MRVSKTLPDPDKQEKIYNTEQITEINVTETKA